MGQTVVLVADADDAIRSLVRLTLGEDSYRTLEASDTAGATEALAADRPDVLVVDVDLPGGGGLDLTRTLRSGPDGDDVRVLLMFDRGDPVDEDAARELGIDAFLAKPFNAFALLRKAALLTGTGV